MPAHATLYTLVAPSRGRGLKPRGHSSRAIEARRPFTGAWIETANQPFVYKDPSRPFPGLESKLCGLDHRTFDGIILDPPTFSRDKQGKVFSVERDYHTLFALAVSCLAPGGWILASTNCRKLYPDQLIRQLEPAVPHTHELDESPMPEDFTGEHSLKSIWMTPK